MHAKNYSPSLSSSCAPNITGLLAVSLAIMIYVKLHLKTLGSRRFYYLCNDWYVPLLRKKCSQVFSNIYKYLGCSRNKSASNSKRTVSVGFMLPYCHSRKFFHAFLMLHLFNLSSIHFLEGTHFPFTLHFPCRKFRILMLGNVIYRHNSTMKCNAIEFARNAQKQRRLLDMPSTFHA